MLASHISNNDDINCATEIVKWELLHTGHLFLYEETKAGRLVFSGKVKLMIIKNSVWGLGSYSLLLSIITCSFNRNNQRDRSTKKSSTFITTYYRDFYSWGKHENKWFNFIKCLMISFFCIQWTFEVYSMREKEMQVAGFLAAEPLSSVIIVRVQVCLMSAEWVSEWYSPTVSHGSSLWTQKSVLKEEKKEFATLIYWD